MARRRNPYDVFDETGDVGPSAQPLMEVGLPLPPLPTRQQRMAWEVEARYRDAPPVERKTSRGPLGPGEVHPADLAVVQVTQDAREAVDAVQLREELGMDVSDEEVNDLDAEMDEIKSDLMQRGYNNREVKAAEVRVWNALKIITLRAARRLLRGRRDLDLVEVATEAAALAFANLNKFQGGSKLSTWVYAITRSLVLDTMSRSRSKGFRIGGKLVKGGMTGLGGLGLGLTEAPATIAGRASVDVGVADEDSVVEELDTASGAWRPVLMTPLDAMLLLEQGDPELRAVALSSLGIDDRQIAQIEKMNETDAVREARAIAESVYEAQSREQAAEQDAAITKAFAKLSPEHQEILQLRTATGAFHLPDGSEITLSGQNAYSFISSVLGIPSSTVGRRLHDARKALMTLLKGKVSPPYFSDLAVAYLALAPQGRPSKSVFVEKPRAIRVPREQSEAERERRAAQRLSAAMVDLPVGTSSLDVVEGMEPVRAWSTKPGWVERRRNPSFETAPGTEVYYETAMDLFDLLMSGIISQEQHDEHVAALMAEEGLEP